MYMYLRKIAKYPAFLLKSQGKTHTHTHTPLLVKRVNWGYLYTPIQTGTFECGYTPAYWGYTKYECDYTPITWGYPNTPSIGDMLLNAFIQCMAFSISCG